MRRLLRKHVLRGLGWVLLYGVISSLLWLSGCSGKPDTPAARKRAETALKQHNGGGSEAIQRYTNGGMKLKSKRLKTRKD